MEELYQVNSVFLDGLIERMSRQTVGKILKRHEVIEDKDTLKKEVRELIYEEYRALKSLIEVHANSLSFTHITFKNNQTTTQ